MRLFVHACTNVASQASAWRPMAVAVADSLRAQGKGGGVTGAGASCAHHVCRAPNEQAEREADTVDDRNGHRVSRGPQGTAKGRHRVKLDRIRVGSPRLRLVDVCEPLSILRPHAIRRGRIGKEEELHGKTGHPDGRRHQPLVVEAVISLVPLDRHEIRAEEERGNEDRGVAGCGRHGDDLRSVQGGREGR